MAESPELWPFSLALYARPGVAPALIALQDRRALDVNLLLYCCWAGSRGHGLSRDEIAALVDAAQPWHERVVRPLRAARRAAGDFGAAGEALYRRLKDQEIAAEEVEHGLLAGALTVPAGVRDTAAIAGNLLAYCAARGVVPDADDHADLAVVLCACADNVRPLEALRLLAGG